MRQDPVLNPLSTQTFTLTGGSHKPESAGHNLPSRGTGVGAGADGAGPETVLPSLLALNLHLLDASAPTAGPRGARDRQA